jgi:squalene-hopene/tetraprenyl-beta-curcumene cyclase
VRCPLICSLAAVLVALSSLSSVPVQAAVTPAQNTQAARKAEALIAKGVDFLKSKQLPNGGWVTDPQPLGISALALRAAVSSGLANSQTDWVKKGYANLLSNQLDSGGIYRDLLANYNTAVAISALGAANDPSFKAPLDKALAYLKSLQWTESIEGGPKGEGKITPDNPWYGGSGYGNRGRPDGSNTQMMLDALHDAGLPPTDPAYQAALKFVSRMQNLSETNDQKWSGNDGGGVYTPANNGESMAGEYTDASGRRLLRSYGSMTYAMLKSFVYAGLTKDDPRVKAAWNWICKNWTLEENPGMAANDPAIAKNGLYYYYLTLARALDAYNQPVVTDAQGNKHDWRMELIDKLSSLQLANGSWNGDARWQEDNPVLVTSYVLIALECAVKDLRENPPTN